MKRTARLAIAAGAGFLGVAPFSQACAATGNQLEPALGTEVFASTDSDKTSVVKLLGRALWHFDGETSFGGLDVERAWFSPEGQHARKQTRVYAEFGTGIRRDWTLSARVGTNGDTILGTASARSNDWSKEVFVEREIVETPRGVDEGIYYTFAGASTNLLARDRDTISAMAGFQKFTGRNDRLHFRATFVHVIKPDLGLSIQLRSRYFHSTVPGEFDYYSPRDFAQVIPVIQMRRFTHTGWMVLIAGGYGAQKATASHWQSARFGQLRAESPVSLKRTHAFVDVDYSNSSLVGAASDYHYVSGRIGLTTRF